MSRSWFDNAHVVNRDPNWIYAFNNVPRDKAYPAAEEYFKAFAGHGITDLCLCVFEQTSVVPSRSWYWRGNKCLVTEEKGMPVDYSRESGIYRYFSEYNVDPVNIFLDVMQRHGIRPWITFRMNDAHFGYDKTSFLRDQEFFDKASENGWMIGDEYGYYSHCYDYGAAEVRKRMLGYLSEIINRYDAFGFELDFMREIHSFNYRHNPDCAAIMTGFISEVRKTLDEAGKKRKHPIKLMVRTCRNIAAAREFGFDVRAWAEAGLIDAIVPTPRWDCNDDGIPVSEWKKLVGDDIAVFPGIEILHLNRTVITPEISKAYAAAWYAQGADGIYFNNHDYPEVERFRQSYSINKETALTGLRRYIVTYQDISSASYQCSKPLPMDISGSDPIELNVGPIAAGDHADLIIETDSEAPAASVNGIKLPAAAAAEPVVGIAADTGEKVCLTGSHTYKYDLAGIVTGGKFNITFDGKGTVKYIEIRTEQDGLCSE